MKRNIAKRRFKPNIWKNAYIYFLITVFAIVRLERGKESEWWKQWKSIEIENNFQIISVRMLFNGKV